MAEAEIRDRAIVAIENTGEGSLLEVVFVWIKIRGDDVECWPAVFAVMLCQVDVGGELEVLVPVFFVQADLTRWWVPRSQYDLIVLFYYVTKGIVPRLASGLKPGGLLFMAQRNKRTLAQRPGFNPAYLVDDGELRCLVEDAGLDVLFSSDAGHNSTLVARLPAGTVSSKFLRSCSS